MSRPPVTIHPRKAFTPKQRAEVFAAAKGRCLICGEKITGPWEVEHRVPLALGGTNEPGNLEPAHAEPCHRNKSKADVRAISKAKRLAGETGQGPKQPIRSRGFDRTLRKKFNGTVERREQHHREGICK